MRKESVVVKIPVSMIRYMDGKVAAGEFSSRNDLVMLYAGTLSMICGKGRISISRANSSLNSKCYYHTLRLYLHGI